MDQLKPVIKPLLISLVIFAHSGFANAPLQQAKAQLSTYETSLKQIGSKVQTIDLRIQSYQTKISNAKSDVATTKIELEAARSALIQARHDKSDKAARKLELAQKKYDITQLGYQNREKRLSRLERKLDAMIADKEKLMSRSAAAQAQLKAQANKVIKLSSAAAQRPSPAVAQKAAAPAKAAVPIGLAEGTKQAPSQGEKSRAPVQTAKLENVAVAKPASLRNENSSPGTIEGSKVQRDYAYEQMTALNKKIEANSGLEEWRQFRGLQLKVGNQRSEEFEYLGARQYYIETELEAGSKRVKIGRKYYKANIPSEGNYVIIYDTADRNSPKFSLFKKNWFE